MRVILFRYSPRVVMLNYVNLHDDIIVIAPKNQEDKYIKFNKNGNITPPIIFLEDYILPNIIEELDRISELNSIEQITTLSEEDMDWVGMLDDYYTKRDSSYVSGKLFKDKYYMRSFLNGVVKQPKFRLLESKLDLELFWKATRIDEAVVKPRDSAGTMGIITLKRNDELDERYYSKNYLIEEKVELQKMLTCDGYAIEKDIIRFFSHEYDELALSSFNSTKDLVVRTCSLYQKNHRFLWGILKNCELVLKRFNCQQGIIPFHFEWFYDIDSKDFVFCEVGKRFGGADIPFLIEYAFGINVLEEYWRFIAGKWGNDIESIKNIKQLSLPKRIACSFLPHKRHGKIIKVPSLDAFNWTENTWIFVKEGDFIEKSSSVVESMLVSEFTAENEIDYVKKLELIRGLTNKIIIEDIKND